MSEENKMENRKSILDVIMDDIDPLDSRKTEDRMLIAARIGELIKERGWKKSLFAANINQQPSVISKWLSGTHNFTLETLTEICYVLETDLQDLFRQTRHVLVLKSNSVLSGKEY